MTVIMIVTIVAAAAAILASCISIAIGLVGIWMVTNFYRLSMELNVRTRETLKDVESAAARLEGVLAGRYGAPALTPRTPAAAPASAGTSASPGPVPLAAMDEQQRNALKAELQTQLAAAMKSSKIKDTKAAALREQVGGILDQFIASSKELVEEIKDVAGGDEKTPSGE